MKRREWLQATLLTVGVLVGAPRGWGQEPWEPVPLIERYSGLVRWSLDQGKTWIESHQTFAVKRRDDSVDFEWLDGLNVTWTEPDTFVTWLWWEVPEGLPHAGFVARVPIGGGLLCYWAADCSLSGKGISIRT